MGEVIDLSRYRGRRDARRISQAEARELLRLFAPVGEAQARRALRAGEPDEILYSSVPWVRPGTQRK